MEILKKYKQGANDMNIRTVTILGANGAMGWNISGVFASFGNAKVYMVCRDIEAAENAKLKASTSVKAEAIAEKLIPKTYDDLKECILSSDLVFESVAEDISVKKEVYQKIVQYIQPHTIISTGTSGLLINKLSMCFDENIRKRFMGIHMFNPPYNMTLCEVIPSTYTDVNLLANIKTYLKTVLYRNVVEIKDAPAFMGNRIGFQFINEAMQYAEMYKDKGGIDYIDSIMGQFTGRSMAPLNTADFVGLDVHKAIVDNVFNNTNDYAHKTFVLPEFAFKLISANKLGRKTGCGLYQTVVGPDGKRTINVYDIALGEFRARKNYAFPFVKKMIEEFKIGNYKEAFEHLINDQSLEATICISFLIKYVLYALVTTREIGENIHSADDVMATGFNWIPPLAVIDAFGGVETFKYIAQKKLTLEFLSQINLNDVLRDIPKSNYDYRPFFKAK
ncbi:3-hydroxyacyl-CoA dehydrogenase family protein [Lachnoclostridium sp.]|uniref:3-hydroxyacyl-CoA dehydrogenase family protein n=1 Tax=Lachnoclostridium sp. TaxID=2028282 RepID=UPI0028A20B56|nr:3-hydroxyacyl-CoA dehydrogenase family protein [Lachnoclostridium sp.]